MLSPDYLARVMEGAEEVASQLHTDILNDVIRRIMIRLDRGDNYVLTATDKWQIETLMEAGYLREDIVADIAKKTNLQKAVIRKAFEDAGVRSLSYDAKVYEAAGLATEPLLQSPALVRILQTMYERTMGEWENITRTTANEAQKLFIQVCDNAYTQVMSGAKARSQAVREAVEEVAKDGIKVVYPTGHEDTIEVATARAVRTGITQSAAQITLERMKEMDVDLVLTSSHLGARPTHEPWQGKVFHVDFSVLTGRLRSANTQTDAGATHSKYPDLVEATRYGYVDGLCGANCRHSMVPYIEGVTKNPFEQFDSEENQKRYEIEQKQREMERKIRKVKREVQGLQEALKHADELTKPGLEAQYQKRAQRLTELNKEYKQYCEANDLKTRQERHHIAGWTRGDAARASGAARRTASKPVDVEENRAIIRERIATGEYSLNLSRQQYLKHVEGTPQFAQYKADRLAKGSGQQSILTVDEATAQLIIQTLAGNGTPKMTNAGKVSNIEYGDWADFVGVYFKDGVPHRTKRVAIHYGKKGSHIVPVEVQK